MEGIIDQLQNKQQTPKIKQHDLLKSSPNISNILQIQQNQRDSPFSFNLLLHSDFFLRCFSSRFVADSPFFFAVSRPVRFFFADSPFFYLLRFLLPIQRASNSRFSQKNSVDQRQIHRDLLQISRKKMAKKWVANIEEGSNPNLDFDDLIQ